MLKKIKYFGFFTCTTFLVVKLIESFNELLINENMFRYQDQLQKIYTEVYSRNLVTGIYLDYRLYDSIFEATILFVVATGIIFMVRKDEEMVDKLEITHIVKK